MEYTANSWAVTDTYTTAATNITMTATTNNTTPATTNITTTATTNNSTTAFTNISTEANPHSDDNANGKNILFIIAATSSVLCAIGIIGNIACAAVLQKMRMKGVRLLKYRSVLDIIILFLVFVAFLTFFLQDERFLLIGWMFHPISRCSILTTYVLQTYLTVLIAIQRSIVVAFPLQTNRYMRQSVVNRALAFILIFSVCLTLPYWIALRPKLYWNEQYKMDLLTIEDNAFLRSRGYEVYSKYVVFSSADVLPWVIMSVSTVILVVARRRTPSTIGQSAVRGKGTKLTVTVILITLISLVTNLVFGIIAIMGISSDLTLLIAIDTLILKSSSNFVVFCMLGGQFRKTAMSLHRRRNDTSSGPSPNVTVSAVSNSSF